MDPGANLITNIFDGDFDFETTCISVFRFQYEHNPIYRQYTDALGIAVAEVRCIDQIPFLPIRFFKTHQVRATKFTPELIFESSGTTQTANSRHYVKTASIYERSFQAGFRRSYGDISGWAVLGLLPSYLERQHSSLVYMVQQLIAESGQPQSGFYLYDWAALARTLEQLETLGQKTLLIGVTFGLLDFAEKVQVPLSHTVVMETGGMKGRRKEMIRAEVHDILQQSFALKTVHSEYGMTELLSQAYSQGQGRFTTPAWMRILVRDEDDPLAIQGPPASGSRRGLINVIDLANLYSCSFIATDDLGVLHPDGHFEVTGRMDNSDLRGCSLMAV